MTDLGTINRPIVSNGTIVVAAGEGGMTGLDAGTGSIKWRVAADGLVTDMSATDRGPVMVHHAGRDSRIVAADWSGKVLWSVPGGGAMGVDSLRGVGDRLFTTGEVADPVRRLVYRSLDAASGTSTGIYPGEVALPHVTRFGLIFPIRSSDAAQAGLYLQTLDQMPRIRLLDLSHSILAIHRDFALLDATDGSWEPSALVAYDLAARRVLWREAGGQVLKFGIDDDIVACARFVAAPTGTVAVRRRATGALVWESEPQEMRDLTVELLDDLLLAEIDSERLQIYDVGSGTKVDELANESTSDVRPLSHRRRPLRRQ